MVYIVIIIIAITVIVFAVTKLGNGGIVREIKSNTSIDITALNQVCMEAGDPEDHDVDFYLVSESVYERITDKGPTPAWLEKNPPARIVYTDSKDEKTIRDITPLRLNGSPGYDFGIEAYCHLRKEGRDFWVSKISAAWCQGREINLGDYLAELCKKTKDYKTAVKEYGWKKEKQL